METITLKELEDQMPELSSAIKLHQSVAVVSGDAIVAEIVPKIAKDNSPRPFGLCKGQFVVPADFNDPVPEVEDAFYGTEA